MKKITLFLGLSIVGLIGFAQQTNDNQLNNETSVNKKVYTIHINESEDFTPNSEHLLISENVLGSRNFEMNTHELVHDSAESVDFESKFIEGAYSYNEYAINFDFEPNTTGVVKI